eukprot:TRINITY_DN4016_c0_g2_i1.p1 TRINITY_DN4016_c0_g2~~TRINITY_DN4016_c0_g2_i1.p1  ORF type:complete len:798 (-),score=150.84 TRINITY_DN4016_c0_g2_i1:59-2368(-)
MGVNQGFHLKCQLVNELKDGCDFSLTPYVSNFRPVYGGCGLFIYHVSAGLDGSHGRWIIGEEGSIGKNQGFVWTESWALNPQSINLLSKRVKWILSQDGSTVNVESIAPPVDDSLIYIHSPNAPYLDGLYTEIGKVDSKYPVFAKNDNYLYYHYESGKWIISKEYMSPSGWAFIDSTALIPSSESGTWFVSKEGVWTEDPTLKIYCQTDNDSSIYDTLRSIYNVANHHHHNSKFSDDKDNAINVDIDEKYGLTVLSNGLHIPMTGIGTGGLNEDSVVRVVSDALRAGYRMIDTASAYNNEMAIGSVLKNYRIPDKKSKHLKNSIFIITKVWPTNLGFKQTIQSIEKSLIDLDRPTVDLALLHWPSCIPEFTWMDCSRASNGTWQESWRAMEKLYSEGKLLSIGVSNFDLTQLNELVQISSIPPHVLQNWMDPVQYRTRPENSKILIYCLDNHIHFQSYSPLVNIFGKDLTNMNIDGDYLHLKEIVTPISQGLHRPVSQVILKWFIQLGLGVIVRSTSIDHMISNLDLFRWNLSSPALESISEAHELLTEYMNVKQKHRPPIHKEALNELLENIKQTQQNYEQQQQIHKEQLESFIKQIEEEKEVIPTSKSGRDKDKKKEQLKIKKQKIQEALGDVPDYPEQQNIQQQNIQQQQQQQNIQQQQQRQRQQKEEVKQQTKQEPQIDKDRPLSQPHDSIKRNEDDPPKQSSHNHHTEENIVKMNPKIIVAEINSSQDEWFWTLSLGLIFCFLCCCVCLLWNYVNKQKRLKKTV